MSITKILLIIAISLVVAGSIIFVCAMTSIGWDFSKLSRAKYVTNSYDIDEPYKEIFIKAETADIVFAVSEDSSYRVECYEQERVKHEVSVKDGTLMIAINDTRAWHDYIGFNFGFPKITVYMPAGEYGALSIKLSTGNVEVSRDFCFDSIDISGSTGKITNFASAKGNVKLEVSTGKILVSNISAGSLDVKVSTGDANISSVRCKSFASDGSTGDIELEDVIAEERLTIKRTTGDVELDRCDAGEIYITTSTGDVEGSLLSEKVFIINTDIGDKSVPNTISGGRCEISTNTGDIEIALK